MTGLFYVINGLVALVAFLFFVKSTTSKLTVLLSMFFFSLAWYQLYWGIYTFNNGNTIPANTEEWYTANVPFCISNLAFVYYLLKNMIDRYRNKKNGKEHKDK